MSPCSSAITSAAYKERSVPAPGCEHCSDRVPLHLTWILAVVACRACCIHIFRLQNGYVKQRQFCHLCHLPHQPEDIKMERSSQHSFMGLWIACVLWITVRRTDMCLARSTMSAYAWRRSKPESACRQTVSSSTGQQRLTNTLQLRAGWLPHMVISLGCAADEPKRGSPSGSSA